MKQKNVEDFLKDISNLPETLQEQDESLEQCATEDTESFIPVVAQSEETAIDTLPPPDLTDIDDEDDAVKTVQDYVLKTAQDFLESTIKSAKNIAAIAEEGDGKVIGGYASLVGSVGKLIDNINAVANERSRIKGAKELEKIKQEGKSASGGTAGAQSVNNFNFIGSRDSFMKYLQDAQSGIVDVTEEP